MAGTDKKNQLTDKDIERTVLFNAPSLALLDPNNPVIAKLLERFYNRHPWAREYLAKNGLVDPNSPNVTPDRRYTGDAKKNFEGEGVAGSGKQTNSEKAFTQALVSGAVLLSLFSNVGLAVALTSFAGWVGGVLDAGRRMADGVGNFFTKSVPEFFSTTLPRMARNAWNKYGKPVVTMAVDAWNQTKTYAANVVTAGQKRLGALRERTDQILTAQLQKFGITMKPGVQFAVAAPVTGAATPVKQQPRPQGPQPRRGNFAAARAAEARQTILAANTTPAALQPGARTVESIQAARAEIRPPEPRPGGRRPLNNVLAARGTAQAPAPVAIAPKATAPVVQIATAHPQSPIRRQPSMAPG